jgi:hypothetical protein
MNGLRLLRRLRAYGEGKPLPYGSTKHLEVLPNSQTLLVAFLRMGGETAPWGIGWKRPGGDSKFLTVPEPRDRELVAQALAGDFADDLATHLLHPLAQDDEYDASKLPPLRQVWLPGPTHIEMLQLIAMAYAFAKKGPAERVQHLQMLGRTANFMFLQAQRPGQQMVVDATRLLRDAFEFPADDLRQAHLGYLLAWLTTKGVAAARIDAATKAEQQAVSTALDPAIDKDELEPLVAAYNEATAGRGEDGRFARKHEDSRARDARRRVATVLERELARRLDLVEAARTTYQRDTRRANPGLAELVAATRKQHWHGYLRQMVAERDGERAFFPSPVTERSAKAAAERYLEAEADEARRIQALSSDDNDLIDAILAGGDGLVGTITAVVDEAPEGSSKTQAVWTVRTEGLPPLRLKEGDEVSLSEFPKRKATIREIRSDDAGRAFVLEITAAKRAPKEKPEILGSAEPKLRRRRVCFLNLPTPFFGDARAKQVRFGEGPGEWILQDTGKPPPESATEDEP